MLDLIYNRFLFLYYFYNNIIIINIDKYNKHLIIFIFIIKYTYKNVKCYMDIFKLM